MRAAPSGPPTFALRSPALSSGAGPTHPWLRLPATWRVVPALLLAMIPACRAPADAADAHSASPIHAGDTAPIEREDDSAPESAEDELAPVTPPAGVPALSLSTETQEMVALVPRLQHFPCPSGLDEEQWARLQTRAREFVLSEPPGDAEDRAWLIHHGRFAWPALINELVLLDPLDPVHNARAHRLTLLMHAARGSESRFGFDWRLAPRAGEGVITEKDVRFNLRLARTLHGTWQKVIEDPTYWDRKVAVPRAR